MLTADGMSEPNREQVTAYMNGVWQVMLKEVAESRKMAVDSLNAYADRFIAMSKPEDYVKMKLVDKLLYTNEVKGEIKKMLKIDADESFPQLTLKDMENVKGKKKEDPDVPLYTIKGYFPSLSAALNHLGEEMVRERLTEGVRPLREAVQAIQECREEWRKITADILEDKT
jgi:protease-4